MEEKHHRVHHPIRQMMLNNFLGGVAWSFGTLIGATIIVALVGFLFSRIDVIPIVGTFITNVIRFIAQNNPNLLQ